MESQKIARNGKPVIEGKRIEMSMSRVRHSLLAIAALLLAACVAVVDAQQSLQPPQVPETLMVAADEQLAAMMYAEGVQIYACKADKDDAAKYQWAFVAPEAVLYDGARGELGKHYAGPTWESNDGSKVVGEVKARAGAPAADAVPWLLLAAKSTAGNGVFSAVTSIQRVETTGGQAPQAGCDQAHLGEEARVPYTAVYYFYTAR